MRRLMLVCYVLVLVIPIASRCRAADPPGFNPLSGFKRSPFSAEFEVFSGGITGDKIGAGYKSLTEGTYGARFTFGFMRALNFSLNYMYSDQTRSFTAVTPPAGTFPAGTALMHARNLTMAWGNGEISIAHFGRSSLYISPGVGFARNGSRSMTLITPLGTASSSILPGTAVSFNLGAGVKVFPTKHFGLRFDLRDFVSPGGTGNLNPQGPQVCPAIYPPPPQCSSIFTSVQQYFGNIPVQNNVVFTVGLIFKLI